MNFITLFPPSIFNRRIVTSVRNFFTDFEALCKTYKLTPCPVTESIEEYKKYSWVSDDFEIKVTNFFKDGAIKDIHVLMKDIPSYTGLNLNKTIRYGNSYTLSLHRNYPGQVGLIQLFFHEAHWHPRFSGHSSKPCMTPTGEVDRLLMDIPFFLMYEPNRVKPQGSDNGVNHQAMMWYQNTGMDKVHKELLLKWFQKREQKYNKSISSLSDASSKGKMLILD